jgi:hypothetical protein
LEGWAGVVTFEHYVIKAGFDARRAIARAGEPFLEENALPLPHLIAISTTFDIQNTLGDKYKVMGRIARARCMAPYGIGYI